MKQSSITEAELIDRYKVVNELTSSSPSGHHIGCYKAALQDPNLASLHSAMMPLLFQAGFAPER